MTKMLCPECKKREATVHLTQIVNNQKVTVSLCKECAAKVGFHSPLDNMPFPLAEILSGMTQNLPQSAQTEADESLVCETCHMTFADFARHGRFGCGGCYSAFRPKLEPIMRKIHGSSLHRGRNPGMIAGGAASQALPIKEEERLDTELRKAIESEDFERAAELRDKLKAMRHNLAHEDNDQGADE
ncbi:MAG: UvrB/UvrC motif-containing protein [Candidatus Zixiibacteriota bacterium]|jgi:protein arginine kinase activator